jgi:hypothetical protein
MIAVVQAMVSSDAFRVAVALTVLVPFVHERLSRVWRVLGIDDDRSGL